MFEKAYRFLDLTMWHVYLGKWYKIPEVFNCESHEKVRWNSLSKLWNHLHNLHSSLVTGHLPGVTFVLQAYCGSQIETVLCLQTITYDPWIY